MNKFSLLSAALVVLNVVSFAQTTRMVPSGAFPNIQSAINVSLNGDTVLVGPGTYLENINFLGRAITVRSSAGKGATTIQWVVSGQPTVLFQTGEGPNSVLEGFTVRNGNPGNLVCVGTSPTIRDCDIVAGVPTLTGTPLLLRSGGVTCSSSASPTFINCLIAGNGNTASDAPGGVLLNGGGASFVNCTIFNNISGGVGGVQCLPTGNPLLVPSFVDCTISANQGGSIGFQAQGGGGGLNLQVNAIIRRCRFQQNVGGADFFGGGGAINIYDASPVIDECFISNNTGAPAFRAVAFFVSQPGSGGGINIQGNSSPLIRNTIITGNTGGAGASGPLSMFPPPPMPWTSNGGAGGIEIRGPGTARILHCVLWNNTGGAAGSATQTAGAGGITVDITSGAAPTPAITNCVVYNNTSPGSSQNVLVNTGSTLSLTYSCIQGGWPGTGNISANPGFVDPATQNFHLLVSSPCINAAINTPIGFPATDFEGEERTYYFFPDIGADEVLDPCAEGVIGLNVGGPLDILTVNGSTTINQSVLVGAPITLDVIQPGFNPSPAAFVLAAHVGPLMPFQSTNLGGNGSLCFPGGGPTTLAVAATFGIPVAPLISTGPAPWTLSFPSGFPFPIAVTLQGVVEESPGDFKVFNAIFLLVN